MKKVKKVKGFVMNRKTGHTSYAFKQRDTMVDSLGFTHDKDFQASKRRLNYNIDPEDTERCYVKTKVERQKYNTYREDKKYSNYRFHKDDMPIINSIIDKAKSKKKKRR